MTDEMQPPDDLDALIVAAFEQGDPVPSSIGGPAPFVSWSAPDAGVALLVDEDELLAVRGPARTTEMRFRSATHAIDLEIGGHRLAGTITPWAGGSAAIETAATTDLIQIDEFGDFAGPAPAGIVRLRFETAAAPIVSEWFLISHDRDS